MPSYKISAVIDEFLISKEVEEGCSPSTIKAYRYDLQKFIEETGDLDLDSPLLRQKVRLFLKKLSERNYTKKGIARKIATLKSFFKFLNSNELTVNNPMTQIRSPKIKLEENLSKFVEISEMERILKSLQNKLIFNTKKSARYYLIVRLLYATMARVSELCGIKVRDIHFQESYINLRGKGNKERIVPVDAGTLANIQEYLRNKIFYTDETYLLVNMRNEKLNPRIVQSDIQTIKRKCGFPESKIITPHVFRHTGATHLRRSGMDISELQDLLGHSSPNTTRIYAKNDISKIKQSYDSMHPLNRDENLKFDTN